MIIVLTRNIVRSKIETIHPQATMNLPDRLVNPRFPRSSRYHPDWIKAAGMGAHPLWITEWLAEKLELRPGMRVLDLGCGKAASSIFLAGEFECDVWATDLWIPADENQNRIHDAGLAGRVIPLHADARSLPFAGEFFDAIVCIDAYPYFGTDSLYLNYLAHFVRPGGQIGIAGAGLVREIESAVPSHLVATWTQDYWALHSAAWWRRLWERTGIVSIESADAMEDGWKVWLDWHEGAHPHNTAEIESLRADQGQYLGYVRLVGRRIANVKLEEYCWPDSLRSMPSSYEAKPLFRGDAR